MNRTDFAETMRQLAQHDAEPKLAEIIADCIGIALVIVILAFGYGWLS